jgi:putative thioredoxin
MQNSSIMDITEQNIQDVLTPSNPLPILFYFWSERSPHCQELTVTLTKLANEFAGQFILAKLNCDEQPMLAGQFGLRAIPTLYLFQNGQPIDGLQGPQSEEAIKQLLEPVLPNEDEQKLNEAKRLMNEGDYNKALPLLKQAWQNLLTPTGKHRSEISLLLAHTYIELKQLDDAQPLLSSIPIQDQNSEYHGLVAQIELLEQAANSPEIQQLQEQLKQQPHNTDLMIQLASQLHQVGRNEEALAMLFAPLMTDLNVGEGQVKKVLLDMLSAIGTNNPLANTYRRKLYSLLY